MFVGENFTSIFYGGMRDSSMRSGSKLAREIQLIGQRRETCLTGPLEYKYRVIFVLVLGVICTLRGAVG